MTTACFPRAQGIANRKLISRSQQVLPKDVGAAMESIAYDSAVTQTGTPQSLARQSRASNRSVFLQRLLLRDAPRLLTDHCAELELWEDGLGALRDDDLFFESVEHLLRCDLRRCAEGGQYFRSGTASTGAYFRTGAPVADHAPHKNYSCFVFSPGICKRHSGGNRFPPSVRDQCFRERK